MKTDNNGPADRPQEGKGIHGNQRVERPIQPHHRELESMKPSIEIQIQGKTKTFPPGVTPAEILRQSYVSGDTMGVDRDVPVGLATRRGFCHDYHASGARLPEDLEKMEARVKELVEAAPERKISCVTILSDKHRGKGSLAILKLGEEKMSELSVQQFVRQFSEEVANRS